MVFTHYFLRQAARQPLVLVCEDLHWSDEASLDFLHYLAHQCPELPLLILATYRSEDAGPTLRHWLAELDRARLAHEIALSPLPPDDIARMVQAIFKLERPVHAAFLHAIDRFTEGNPFFIEETLTSLVTAGDLVPGEHEWDRTPMSDQHIPRSVQDAVQQRVARVSPTARRVSAVAAVIGRSFDFGLLQQLVELEESALVGVIKELIAARLLVEESAERFAFRHALTRQAIYLALLARERRTLHQAVAETLERSAAASSDGAVADLAYHTYEAGAWDKALTYAQRAGELAHALDAPRAAIEQFSRALAAATLLGRTPPLQLYRARGLANETLGDFEHAQADHEAALALARAAQDRQAEWRALLDLGFLWSSRDYARTGAAYRQALSLARAMDDPATLAHSLNQVGNWYVNSEQSLDGLRYHHEALTLFAGVHDRRGVAETLDLLGLASRRGGDLTGAADYYRRAIQTFRDLGDRRGLVSCLSTLTLCTYNYSATTTISAAVSVAERGHVGEEALRVARDIGWRAGEAYALLCLSFCLGTQGDYTPALQNAQAGLAIAEAIEHRQWMAAAWWGQGVLYLDLLALAEAQRRLTRALELAQAIGSQLWLHHVVGWLVPTYVAQGDLEPAELLIRTFPMDAPMQTLGQRQCWCACAELALARGDPQAACAIMDQLIASAPRRAGQGESALPRLAKLRGDALAALGRLAEAEATFRHAEQGARGMGLRPLQWRIHAALGRLYLADQRPHDAERAFATAHALVQELARLIAEQSLRDAFTQGTAALLPAPPVARPAVGRAPDELTPREGEVLRLIAVGKSNQEIAGELVVSVRTVERHISTIYQKLGLSGRAARAAATAYALSHDRTGPGLRKACVLDPSGYVFHSPKIRVSTHLT